MTSLTLLEELEDKLRTKFAYDPSHLEEAKLVLNNVCEVVSTQECLSVIKADPDDDRVLECAVAGHADYIVSGDKHLLSLGSYEGIQILNVRQFMDILTQKH